jgi:lipoate-protein ligase B
MSTADYPDLPVCRVSNLGVVPSPDARTLQEKMPAEISSGLRPPTLLLLEQPHTFTFGRRGQGNHLLWSESELENSETKYFRSTAAATSLAAVRGIGGLSTAAFS